MCSTAKGKAINPDFHCDIDSADAVSNLFQRLTLSPHWPIFPHNANISLQQPEGWKEGMPRVGLLYDEAMLRHQGPLREFEKPGRVSVPFHMLTKDGTIGRCFILDHHPASTTELAMTHSTDYIHRVGLGDLDFQEDVFWNQQTDSSARMAVGCSITAVAAVLDASLDTAFVLNRPPGHHAEFDMARGFCFYNNAAIAAVSALKDKSRCKRVVILDWDVHHGNGTQNAFYKDNEVLYISLHRGGAFYPGTGSVDEIGEGKGKGFTINIPWPGRGFGDADYLAAFEVIVEPVISAFQPDLTIISAGFDATIYDPLGGMLVTPDCFGILTRRVVNISPKTVMILEGGYNLLQLTACIKSCLKALLGDEPHTIDSDSSRLLPQTEETLFSVADHLSTYWPCLSSNEVADRIQSFNENVK